MRYKYHVHPSNERALKSIEALVDESGKPPWSPLTWDIIGIIAGFDRSTGCFMSHERMIQELGRRASKRTLRRHEAYLEAIGVISKYREKIDTNKTRCIRRLVFQDKSSVPSFKKFAYDTGKYSKHNVAKSSIFFAKGVDKMAIRGGQNGHEQRTKWPPNIESNKSIYIETNLPNPPSRVFEHCEPIDKNWDEVADPVSTRPPSEACGPGIRRARREGCRPRNPGTNFFKDRKKGDSGMEDQELLNGLDMVLFGVDGPGNLDANASNGQHSHDSKDVPSYVPMYQDLEETTEPLPKTRRRRQTQREKKAELVRMHNAGHIVNPLGPPDTRLRMFDWKRARDIAPEGAVTAAQLWRHLCLKYREAFGPDLLEKQLPQDKYGITSWFDGLRAKFVKTCGYDPDYRELSEYFTWILDPARLARMNSKKSSEPLKIQQMEGGVYMKHFFDQILSTGKYDDGCTYNENVTRIKEAMRELVSIFDTIDDAYDRTTSDMILCMARFGFPLVLQYLIERKGMTEAGGRRKLVDLMARFMSESTDLDAAVKYMAKAVHSTDAYSDYYTDATVWKDYQAKCQGLVEEAERKARTGKNEDNSNV